MRVSLRTRLFLGVIVSTALLLGIFCILLYTVTRSTLIRQFDNSLLSTAKMLSAIVENEGFEGNDEKEHDGHKEHADTQSNSRLEFEFDVRMTPEFNNLNGGGYYQFWNNDRTAIMRSPSLGDADLPYFGKDSSTEIYRQFLAPGGKAARAVSYRFIPRMKKKTGLQETDLIVVVGRDASDLYGFLGFFRLLLLNCSAAIILLSGFVAAKVAKIGLRPVHTLANAIESVDEKVLEQSFSSEAYPVELVPICDRLNALMERIKSSFERERCFNADVAHELRTPLAGIQSTIEVCLSCNREEQEYKGALERCLSISKSMNRLVRTLLALSRLESQQIAFESQTIPLKGLVDKTWQNFADTAYDKKLSFENRIDDSLCCSSDADHLGMILSNILDNAVEYCNEQGQILVKAQHTCDAVKLTISNTGCCLSAADCEHVFDFFWRADAARTGTGTHCGIGLEVVRKMAKVLGIKVTADIEQEAIFSIILELPTDRSVCS